MAAEIATTATAVATATVVPVVTILGISTGLQPDNLLIGLLGSIAGLTFLDNSPGLTDTWKSLLKTTLGRFFVVGMSAITSGYFTPVVQSLLTLNLEATHLVSFIIGTSAQQVLKIASGKLPKVINNVFSLGEKE